MAECRRGGRVLRGPSDREWGLGKAGQRTGQVGETVEDHAQVAEIHRRNTSPIHGRLTAVGEHQPDDPEPSADT